MNSDEPQSQKHEHNQNRKKDDLPLHKNKAQENLPRTSETALLHDAAVVPLDLTVALKIADVKPAARHLHGMDRRLSREPCDETSGSISTAASGNRAGDP